MIISVITPTKNARQFLDECLESVSSQGTGDLEIEHLIVDSSSTDGTAERAAGFGATVLAVEPVGLYHSINIGIEHAKGDILCVLGGDDTVMPGALTEVAAWHEQREHPWLIGAIKWTDSEGAGTGVLRPPPSWMSASMYASLGWSCIQSQATFLTRPLLDHVGRFSEDFRYSGDYDFYARTLREVPFDRTNSVLATFRRHGNNISMAPDPLRGQEDLRIQDVYGPASARTKKVYRDLLRIWLNARNPGWFLAKHF